CRSWMGVPLIATGKNDEALAVLRLARSDQEALAAAPDAAREARRDLASTITRIAVVLSERETGKRSEAEAEYRTAPAVLQKLVKDSPDDASSRERLMNGHNNLGHLLSITGRPAEAQAEFRTALTILQKLADDNPAVTNFRHGLAKVHYNLALCLNAV